MIVDYMWKDWRYIIATKVIKNNKITNDLKLYSFKSWFDRPCKPWIIPVKSYYPEGFEDEVESVKRFKIL